METAILHENGYINAIPTYTGCANTNFLCQGFRNRYRLTDRQTNTTEVIHHAASRVVKKLFVLKVISNLERPAENWKG